MHAIEAHGLTKIYAGGVEALRGIDLEVAPGEVFGLLGPNGAGKSTLIRMLTTLLPPTAGTALVNGFDVVRKSDDVRRSIGVIPGISTRSRSRRSGTSTTSTRG